MVATFSVGSFAGPDLPAADVLADPHGDTTGICEPYAGDQSLVAAEELDLDILRPKLRSFAQSDAAAGRSNGLHCPVSVIRGSQWIPRREYKRLDSRWKRLSRLSIYYLCDRFEWFYRTRLINVYDSIELI